MSLKFSVSKLQTALFLRTIDLAKKLDLGIAIRDSSDGLLDGDPVILPIPPEAPPDLPRVIIRSQDERWRCQVASARIDVHFNQKIDRLQNQILNEITATQIALVASIWQTIQHDFRASASRIGFITSQVALLSEAQLTLAEAFLTGQGFDSAHRMEIHVLHKLALSAYPINRWTRFRAMPAPAELEYDSILEVEIDINTTREQQLDLSAQEIRTFSQQALILTTNTLEQFLGNSI